MYNIQVKKVPYERWMNEKGMKVIDDFNQCGKHLTLSFYDEPENTEVLESMLEEGMYDFIYPDCKESKYLKAVIDEAELYARCIYFEINDLLL